MFLLPYYNSIKLLLFCVVFSISFRQQTINNNQPAGEERESSLFYLFIFAYKYPVYFIFLLFGISQLIVGAWAAATEAVAAGHVGGVHDGSWG